jgi:transposase InsO family protein
VSLEDIRPVPEHVAPYQVHPNHWASRAVLSWRLSNTMDVPFCVEAIEEALACFYLKGYADGREAKAGIAVWIALYNGQRPHMALDKTARRWRCGARASPAVSTARPWT